MHFHLRVSHGQQQFSCCMRERNNTYDVKVKSKSNPNRKQILEPTVPTTTQHSISNHSSLVETNNSDHFANSDSQRSSRSTGSGTPLIKWSRQKRSTSIGKSSTTNNNHTSNSTSTSSSVAGAGAAMNLSDHFSNNGSSHHRRRGQGGGGDISERVALPLFEETPQQKTPQLLSLKRFLAPGSWHGESSSSSSHSRNKIPGPPLLTPSPSPGGKKGAVVSSSKKLASALPALYSPRKQKKQSSPNLLNRFNGRERSGSISNHSRSTSNHSRSTTTAAAVESTTTASTTTTQPTPKLYRTARKGRWEEFANLLSSDTYANLEEDVGYIYRKDGTTALHMAVMSITGYLNSFKTGNEKELVPAPIEVVEKLLQINADMCKVKCALNGYTPLTYACLVCDSNYDMEQTAAVVRLILKYCPESIDLMTDDGLSPVDIHIISYSANHPEKEEESTLGRTSTTILRTLLTQCPELANSRLRGDRVEGPIELLYKCNSSVFSKSLIDDLNQCQSDDASTTSELTLPERRQQVVDKVKTWWIWTWTVMILKYGSLKQKKRGSRFEAVHTSAMQIGCPTAIFSLFLYAFPRQIKKPIEDKDSISNLPLHAVCSWPCHQDHQKLASEAVVSIRKSNAISHLLLEYPLAVKTFNGRGESALELAIMTGTTWEGGIRRLVKAYPKALRFRSRQTGLYPFMTAAAVAAGPASSSSSSSASPATATPKQTPSSAVKKPSRKPLKRSSSQEASSSSSQPPSRHELQSLRTIYSLLRSNPKVLTLALQKSQQQQDER